MKRKLFLYFVSPLPPPTPPPPVDGQWAAWIEADKSDCNDACVRTETFVRSCTNPTPQHGGHHCTGNTTFVLERACKWDFCGKIMRASAHTHPHTHTHMHARARTCAILTSTFYACMCICIYSLCCCPGSPTYFHCWTNCNIL